MKIIETKSRRKVTFVLLLLFGQNIACWPKIYDQSSRTFSVFHFTYSSSKTSFSLSLSLSLSLALFFSDFFLFSFLSSFSIGASLSGLARAAPSLSRAAYLRAMPESEFIRAIRALLCIVTARSDTKESVLSMHPETVGLVYNVDRHECHDRDEQWAFTMRLSAILALPLRREKLSRLFSR